MGKVRSLLNISFMNLDKNWIIQNQIWIFLIHESEVKKDDEV